MPLQTRRFRKKPVAFWCIGADSIEIAVIRNAVGEPFLEACAAVDCRALGRAPLHCGGMYELAGLLEATGLGHVAALGAPFCRLVEPGGGLSEPSEPGQLSAAPGRLYVESAAEPGLVCDADAAAAAHIASDFDALGLRLLAMDCAPCAEMSLDAFLGTHRPPAGADGAAGATLSDAIDPLAAVSVAPEYEEAAVAMGTRLAVPVGLALAHLGWLVDA